MWGGGRLGKFLAHSGVASRRAAEQLIVAGRVTINGRLVTDPAHAVGRLDQVYVDGRRVQPEARVVMALYKPTGVVSTAQDDRGRPAVVELVPPELGRLYPIGRLDADSEGLLLLSNDGPLTLALLHPRGQVPRTYRLLVHPVPQASTLIRLRAGVRIAGGLARPSSVKLEQPLVGDRAWLRLVLHEGRHREARRICAANGLAVERLIRVAFGSVGLGSLRPGEYRILDVAEVRRLWGSVRHRVEDVQ